jgi:hypothetical protein
MYFPKPILEALRARDHAQKREAAVPPITHVSSAALSPVLPSPVLPSPVLSSPVLQVPDPAPHASSADAARLYGTSPASPEGA